MPVLGDWISRARIIFRFALVLLLAACGDGGEPGGPPLPTPGNPPALDLRLQQVGTALGLNFPLFVTAPPGDNTRLFVVEKNGVIKIINLATQQTLSTSFLNLTSEINPAGEGGMLGLAFHPNYSLNGFFYVYIINLSGDTEIRRYNVPSTTPNVADPMSAQLVLSIDQPAATNHKAGWLGFGQDGFLYAALGDGGSNSGTAQDLNTLLGKILRLDVNADGFPGDPLKNYAIPGTNPFAGIPGLDEIWSYGLRNPFRVSFDRLSGDFYIADVGQNRQEEVNVSTLAGGGGSGTNYGWNTMEGSLCFNPMMGCSTGGLALPVIEYDHSQGCSITGGYVYRGAAIPSLRGTYFYGDFCQGFVRSFRLANGVATEQTDWAALRPGGQITSFGEDAAGELYIVTSGGGLFRIVQ